MSRIAVVGVGAIGCVFGGYLAATGRHEVIFSEVSVESDFGKVNAPAHTVMEPTGLEPAD
jgi:ketopantoate reductase